ncbi:vomeronasal type-1 receptor 48-like [Callospermophilus lateralis]|uniref:vomeronasal type-1 receptor 48-like n=1 Tax=Callospermophilus lateralis TaxID=76772 RepID=UPI004038F406
MEVLSDAEAVTLPDPSMMRLWDTLPVDTDCVVNQKEILWDRPKRVRAGSNGSSIPSFSRNLQRPEHYITGHRPKPIDLPIGLLVLIHLVILLINGFIAADIFTPQSGRWDDLTSKLLIYLYRLMRGLSICATCLLSVLQAIIFSPKSSCLAKFKHKSSCHNLCFLLFLWVIYSSFSSHLFISIAATPNWTSNNFMYITESCSFIPMTFFLRDSLSTLLTFREISFIGIMTISNVYMVALLCWHKRQSRCLHSTSLPPVSSPELRATQTILLLMSCFVVMSILDSIVSYARITLKDDPIFYCIQILVTHSYASFSPLVFICTEKCIISIFRYMWEKIVNISVASGG